MDYYITQRISKKQPEITDAMWTSVINQNDVEFDIRQEKHYSKTKCVKESEIRRGYYSEISTSNKILNFKLFGNAPDVYTLGASSFYNTFYIPKRNGGKRRIDAPNNQMKRYARSVQDLLQNKLNMIHHCSAYAYSKNRNTLSDRDVHRRFGSKWFFHSDFNDFFGSTTLDFCIRMLMIQNPFCYLRDKANSVRVNLISILRPCFLNGGLPQGSPISPWLTNQIMVPIDCMISSIMRKHGLIYTRYADDICISGKEKFNPNWVKDVIKNVCQKFDAPYTIKNEKCKFTSSSGKNWYLGLMLNKDGNITIGHERKRYLKAMLTNYILDTQNGKTWDSGSKNKLFGLISYYKMIEPEYIDEIIQHLYTKFNFKPINKQISSRSIFDDDSLPF